MTKFFWSLFPGIIERDKTQRTIDKGLQAILTFTLEVIEAFL